MVFVEYRVRYDRCRVVFQAAEIERRIVQETEAEKHIQKLLLLGMCILASHYLCYL